MTYQAQFLRGLKAHGFLEIAMKAGLTKDKQLLVRNVVFGVEDSLVSTVGLLSGVAAAGLGSNNIILAGIVLIFVEAFSMGVGSFLSEQSVEEYAAKKEVSGVRPEKGGVVMFFSYFVSGFVPLSPYFIFGVGSAFWISIVFSMLSLFLLGVFSARIFKINVLRKGVQTLIVGGIAIILGVVVGEIIKTFQ